MLTRRHLLRTGALAGVALGLREVSAAVPAQPVASPDASPCASDMTGMGDMSTPIADLTYDQAYIDMMIPHHLSVIALATHAEPSLKDPRLQTIAQQIITSQPKEVDTLKADRKAWFGSDTPGEMTDQIMTVALGLDSGCVPQDMMQAMDSTWQVSTFDAADNKDLAFIDQVVPHHKMAVDASKVAETSAQHPELVKIAQNVIGAQQAEIDDLQKIRQDLSAH